VGKTGGAKINATNKILHSSRAAAVIFKKKERLQRKVPTKTKSLVVYNTNIKSSSSQLKLTTTTT